MQSHLTSVEVPAKRRKHLLPLLKLKLVQGWFWARNDRENNLHGRHVKHMQACLSTWKDGDSIFNHSCANLLN